MADLCTCGATLVPDALFCHKCGRPLRDLAVEEAPPPPRVVLPEEVLRQAAEASPDRVSFHNPVAVRTGLLLGGLLMLVSFIPLLGWFSPVWSIAAGFASVPLYRKRTRAQVGIGSGLRLGYMTGVIAFTLWLLMLTLAALGGVFEQIKQVMRDSPVMNQPGAEEALRLLESPAGMAFFGVTLLLVFFFVYVVLCAAGGALGAKIAGKDS